MSSIPTALNTISGFRGMKLYLWTILAAVPTVIATTCCGQSGGTSKTLEVTPYIQEGYYTCWAVCFEMIIDYVGGERIRQCEQAGLAKESDLCCVNDGLLNEECDFQWFPMFAEWGFPRKFRRTPLSWGELKTEINEGRPIAFAWLKNPPVAHMNVIVGYQEHPSGAKEIEYLEPNFEDDTSFKTTAFEDYNGTSGRYGHHSNYFRIGATGP